MSLCGGECSLFYGGEKRAGEREGERECESERAGEQERGVWPESISLVTWCECMPVAG